MKSGHKFKLVKEVIRVNPIEVLRDVIKFELEGIISIQFFIFFWVEDKSERNGLKVEEIGDDLELVHTWEI